jgi:hypothetical protein
MLKVESMDFERTADLVMTVLPLPVALWMGLTGNLVSVLGLLSFSTIALLRRRSTRVRQWTNQHQWLFLAILTPIAVATTLDAMP